jgi:putative transposase
MPNYRRNRVPGGKFFFTVNLRDRRSDLLVTGVDRLRAAVRRVRALAPFHIDAWMVLPDHPHPSLPRKRATVFKDLQRIPAPLMGAG